MDLFTYLMAKKGHNTHRDLFSYLLGKNAGGSGTYTTFSGTSLNISNTLQARIKNIALEGNTSQDGTPTPDTPIPIKVATGEQNITIQSKNLFDTSTIEQGGFNYHTGENFTSNEIIRNTIYNIKSNTQYTISCNKPLGECAFCCFDKNGNSLGGNFTRTTNNNYTFTTNSSTSYIKIRIGNSSYPKVISDSYDVQLEQSSTATSYVSYQSQTYPISLGDIELCKINDYKDYIFKNVVGSPYYNANLDLNEWYLHKEIEKVVLDGTEGWNLSSLGAGKFYLVLSNNFKLKQDLDFGSIGIAPLSSHFIGEDNSSDFKNNYAVLFYIDYTFFLRMENDDTPTLSNWETWLSTHNPIVYYVLATPTNTKITDTTLIQQLENINNNARSYKDTTIIECTSESTDNEVIGFSGDIKVSSVGLGNSLNTSLLSSNIQEETNIDDIQEETNLDDVNEIEEQNDEPIENEEIEKEVS